MMRGTVVAVSALGFLAMATAASVHGVEVRPEGKFADPCKQYGDSCAACASDDRCGWCSSSQRCLSGSLDGPKLEHCPDTYWQYAFCKDAACADYTECSTCLADNLCGWCAGDAATADGQAACMEGNASQPTAGLCAGAWVTSPVTMGLDAEKTAALDMKHLSMLRDTCASSGFDAIKAQSVDREAPGRPAPMVLAVSPAQGPEYGGTVITVTGAHFVEQLDGVDDSQVGHAGAEPNPVGAEVLVGGLPCRNVVVKSTSILTCETPPWPRRVAKEDLALEVRIGGTSSNRTLGAPAEGGEGPAARPDGHRAAASFSYGELRVLSVAPPQAPTEGGAALTVRGTFMGPRPQDLHIKIGGRPCLAVAALDDQSVQCIVGPGTGQLLDVQVTISNYTAVGGPNQLFSYEEPRLVSIKPSHGPTTGNTTVTVFGHNFGPAEAGPIALIGGVPCRETVRLSQSALRCLTPPGAGSGRMVSVVVPSILPAADGRNMLQGRPTRQRHALFSFDAPVVTAVRPDHGRAMGGDVVIIEGLNLASGLPQEWQPNQLGAGLTADQRAAQAVLHRVIDEGNLSPSMKQYTKSLLWSVDVPLEGANASAAASPVSHVARSMAHAARHSLRPAEARSHLCRRCAADDCAQEACRVGCPGQCGTFAKEDDRVAKARKENAPPSLDQLQDTIRDAASDSGAADLALLLLRVTARGPSAEASGVATADEVPVGVNYTRLAPAEVARRREASEQNSASLPVQRAPCSPGVPDYTPFGRVCVHAYINGRHCAHMEVIGAMQVACTTPPNVGRDLSVQVKYAGVMSTAAPNTTVAFSADPPTVRQVAPTHTSAVGGVTITVHGDNFGEENAAPVVRVGDRRCKYSAWIDDHTLECGVPGGVGLNHSVDVAVGGQHSGPNTMFGYDGPVVTGAKPNHGPPRGGYWMEVYGSNFGPFDNSVEVSVAGKLCAESVWMSDDTVKCRVPAGTGRPHSIDVVVGGQKSAPNRFFSYDGPIVEHVRPSTCSTKGGCRVELAGSNFGHQPHASLRVSIGGQECGGVQHLGHDRLSCIVPPGLGKELAVEVHLSGQRSEPNRLFSYAPPTVTGLSPAHGAQKGQQIVIHGREFGEEEPADGALTISVGEQHCLTSRWVSFSRVVCSLPRGAGANLAVRVRLAGQESAPFRRFDYDPPRLQRVHPAHGPTEGGTELTLHGANFFEGMRVLIGDERHSLECHTVRVLTPEKAVCTAPPGFGRSHDLELAVAGRRYVQVESHGAQLVLSLPLRDNRQGVASRERPSVPVQVVRELLQRKGKRSAREMLGERRTVTYKVEGEDDAEGGAGDADMDVQLLPEDGRAHVRFSYDVPVVEEVTPTHAPTVGGRVVTVRGKNFGPAGSRPEVRVNVGTARDVGGDNRHHRGTIPCRNTTWVSQKEVKCLMPSGIDASRDMDVIVDGQRSRPVHQFSYDVPVVTGVEPAQGRPQGGDRVRIKGKNFGTADTKTLKAFIGGRPCPEVRWVSDSEVEAVTPLGDSTEQPVAVEVTGRRGEPAPVWNYLPPKVERISPNNERVRGGGTVNIYGENFGDRKNEAALASINGSPCQSTQRVSPTHLRCSVPAGMGHNLAVVVHLGNQKSAPNTLFNYTDVDCQMGEWSEWTQCSHPCAGQGFESGHAWAGPGKQKRTRRVTVKRENGGQACPKAAEERPCATEPCPVHCEVTEWSEWSKCSRSCKGYGPEFGHEHEGPGTQVRQRKVVREPNSEGRPCPKSMREERTCNTHDCRTDCKMTEWSAWSECSRECKGLGRDAGHDYEGSGTQQRTREVKVPAKGGGAACGAKEESRRCNEHTCPIDCKMSDWEWTKCTETCRGRGAAFGHDHVGVGERTRTRTVIRPANFGGEACPAFRKETVKCNDKPCPVDCKVSEWSEWTKCPRPDPRNPASQKRTRKVLRQLAHGGQRCPELEQERKCPLPNVKPKTCRSSGDPHTTTFDGAWHDFYQSGEFWYARSDDGLFDVQAYLVKCGRAFNGGHYPTCIRGTAIRMDGQVIVAKRGIYVNGRRFNGNKKFGSVHVSARGRTVTVTNARQETVRARGSSLYITASYSLARRSKGLCGNFNGNWKDDFTDNGGKQWDINSWARRRRLLYAPGSSEIQQWGSTYRVSSGESLFTKGMARFAEVSATLETAEEVSANASAEQSPKNACSGLGLEPELMDSCMGDISMTGDYSYVDVYKAAQKMADAAAKDQKSLEEFDTVPVGNLTRKANIELKSNDTPPSDDRSWWQLLLP